MTIAIFCYGLTGGGIERVTVTLARLWQQRGYTVILCVHRPVAEADHFVLPEGVDVVAMPRDIQKRQQTWVEVIKKRDVQFVIYQHQSEPLLGSDARTIRETGARIVVCTHDSAFGDRYFNNKIPVAGKPRAFADVDMTVCLSPVEALYWGRMFRTPVSCIYNPLSFEVQEPGSYKLASRDVVWVGRFSSEKRLRDAIDAYAITVKSIEDGQLFILGGSQREIEWFRSYAAAKGLKDRVTFTGMTKDVAAYFKRARLYLLTSFNESYSLSLAEAKSCGVPTVMYELKYLPLAKNEQGVVSVPKGDVQQLAQAMIRLLTDDDLCRQKSEEAIRSLQVFRNEVVLAQWEALFAKLHATPCSFESEIKQFETEENYRLVLDEVISSWGVYTNENVWKVKLVDFISQAVPARFLKSVTVKCSKGLRIFYS